MNHHQRKVLQAIFAHPVNANLDMKDVMNVLAGLGAEIDTRTKARIGVKLNGKETLLHLASHSLMKAEVIQIRKFLESSAEFTGAFIRSEPLRTPHPASGRRAQFRRNSPSTARNSAGLMRRAWAIVTECRRPSSSRVQKSRNFLSSGKFGCRSCCCQM